MIRDRLRHRQAGRIVLAAALVVAVSGGTGRMTGAQPRVLRLATTTSTADTGLLAAILPSFERLCACRVDVLAVGTGQALAMGRKGDVDVLLVHARKAEDAFVAEGHALSRADVMYNDFVIAGPAGDPAGIAGMALAREAFAAVAKARAPFVSRGDNSGTHAAELAIWAEARLTPAPPWYRSVGQGMGEALMAANEMNAYALSDRATWLAMGGRATNLRLLVGGSRPSDNPDRSLRNSYGVIAVSPDRHPGVRDGLARQFVAWITDAGTQRVIGEFGQARYGQALFYPDSDDYTATRQVTVTSGSRLATLSVGDLQALPRVSVPRFSVIGVKKGVLGPFTWTGALLTDVLLKVDPTLREPRHAGSRIVIRCSDGWESAVWWDELFGAVAPGLALYNAKGCNECHGALGEGTAPRGKRPAPALAEADWPPEVVEEAMRTGGARHAGMSPYTEAQLSRADLLAMLAWLRKPHVTGRRAAAPSVAAPTILAYERDGRPMTGAEGLVQLIVGTDAYAARYAHWVSAIDVTGPVR